MKMTEVQISSDNNSNKTASKQTNKQTVKHQQ